MLCESREPGLINQKTWNYFNPSLKSVAAEFLFLVEHYSIEFHRA